MTHYASTDRTDTPNRRNTMTTTDTNDKILDLLDQMYRDMIRTETRLCRLAIALGQGHVLHREQEAAK